MATIQQSLELKNRIKTPEQRFVGTAIAIGKFLLKHIDILERRGKKSGKKNSERSKKNGGDDASKKIISLLEDIKSDVGKILEYSKTLNEALSKFKERDEEQAEDKGAKSEKKFMEKANIVMMFVKNLLKSFFLVLAAYKLFDSNGFEGIIDYARVKLDERLYGTTEPPPPPEGTATLEEKQAKLDEALNNLLEGFNIWRGKNALTEDDKIARLESILNNLSAGVKAWRDENALSGVDKQEKLNNRLNALVEGIKNWETLTMFEKQAKLNTSLNALAKGMEAWREGSTQDDRQAKLNERLSALETGIKEWGTTRTVQTADDKQDKLNKRLNALETGVETWHSSRKDSETGTTGRDAMVKSFKDTLTEMAIFLKTVFEEPVKAVEKQFVHMGVVTILVLRKIESEIDSVATALGKLQVKGATLVPAAQDTTTEAEKKLQSIPSAEKSLVTPADAESAGSSTSTASTQGSVSMQQSADAYNQ